jgi:hypothetical protein
MKKTNRSIKIQKGMPQVHGEAVQRLTHGLKPVKPLMPLWVQWLCWVAGIAALVALYMARISFREDFADNIARPSYGLMVVLIFLGAALAAWGAIEASIPAGESKGRWKYWLAILLYGSAFLLFVVFLPWDSAENYPHHPLLSSCFLSVLLVGTVGWLGLGLLIRHNAPLNAPRVAFWAGISAFLVGLEVVTLHCGSHNLAHICLEHFLPVLVYSGLVGWLGSRWLCSWKRKPLTK